MPDIYNPSESDPYNRPDPHSQNVIDIPGVREAIQDEITKSFMPNRNPDFSNNNDNQQEDSVLGIQVGTTGRIIGEAAIAGTAFLLARGIEPSIIAGIIYAVTQTSRAVIDNINHPAGDNVFTGVSPRRKNPDGSTSVYSIDPLTQSEHITIGEEIFRRKLGTDSHEKRKMMLTAKGLGVALFTVYLSLGAPTPSQADDDSAEISDETVATSQPLTESTVESTEESGLELRLNYECTSTITPIPFEETSKLSNLEKAEYEGYVKSYQELLQSAGLYEGPIDGIAGSMTQDGTYELKKRLASAGVEGLEDTPVLTTQDCLIFEEYLVWQTLIQNHSESLVQN